MVWARLDDQFHGHPKLAEIDPDLMLAAVGLHTMTLSWCADQLTDGVIPKSQPRRLAGGPVDNLIDELVRVGLWETIPGGYAVHDYLDYNPSKAQVEAERQRKSEGGRRGGKASARARREAYAQGQAQAYAQGGASGDACGGSGTPVPIPVPIDLSEGSRTRERDSPDTDFEDVDFSEDEDEKVDNKSEAQKLVAFYVDEHKRVCGSVPTDRQTGILAEIVAKKLRGGSRPGNVRSAITSLVSAGGGPTTLPGHLDKLEAAIHKGKPRDTFPPPEPPMTDEEKAAALEAAAEGKRELLKLSGRVGKGMP